jgi:hypothetical protein
MLKYLINLIMLLSVLSSSLVSYMYYKGGYYYNKLHDCQKSFCGINVFDYSLPDELRDSLLNVSNNAVRVDIKNWKYGRTVSTKGMPSNVLNFYNDFSNTISDIVGETVYPTPLNLPTSCCMLVYDKEGDFINWHFDVNYFDGRFFTVLIPITLEESHTKFKYKDSHSNDVELDLGKLNKSVVFEGNELFHMATNLGPTDNMRIVLSLQYTTNININYFNRFLMGVKDLAYIPVF